MVAEELVKEDVGGFFTKDFSVASTAHTRCLGLVSVDVLTKRLYESTDCVGPDVLIPDLKDVS